MKRIWKCESESNLLGIAEDLVKSFPLIRKIAIYGEMGVGKTTLVKSICQVLKVKDLVSSPTFSIVNEYFSNQNGLIFHFDFYRLKNEKEAFDIGYEHYFQSDSYCFLEWPDRISNLLTNDFARLDICLDNETRIIKLETYD